MQDQVVQIYQKPAIPLVGRCTKTSKYFPLFYDCLTLGKLQGSKEPRAHEGGGRTATELFCNSFDFPWFQDTVKSREIRLKVNSSACISLNYYFLCCYILFLKNRKHTTFLLGYLIVMVCSNLIHDYSLVNLTGFKWAFSQASMHRMAALVIKMCYHVLDNHWATN